jgi:uncharacterized phage infection (PIP) family protein YhgE
MSDQELRQLLDKLKTEITTITDTVAVQRLSSIASDLEHSLTADNNDNSSNHDGLTGAIQDAVTDLETRHPDATTLLNNIMMALANIGI